MTRRPASVAVVAVVAVVALVAGCAGSDTGADTTPGPAAAIEPGSDTGTQTGTQTGTGGDVGSVADAAEVAAGAPASAGGVACDVTRRMLETASEVYLTINATPAPSQLALVEADLIEELSAWFEVTADGAVVPAPASPCP